MAELKPCPFCGGKKISYSLKASTSNYQRISRARCIGKGFEAF